MKVHKVNYKIYNLFVKKNIDLIKNPAIKLIDESISFSICNLVWKSIRIPIRESIYETLLFNNIVKEIKNKWN